MDFLKLILLTLCFMKFSLSELSRSELLLEDPSLWPGHMEPFGSKQKTVEVEKVTSWPDPIDFFTEYVDKNRPVLFKGLAKESSAYKVFNDDYLGSYPGADTDMVYAEPEKKENRTKRGSDMSFKDFILRYHKESLYMVNALPQYLRKDVRIPAPLRCEDTRPLMSSQVTWFSSGGTKSVVHNDDVDNINCLYRGSKELLFIEYSKNKKFVPIDQPQGGYSSIDVDKVNYTKYPLLRNVDQYVHATMQEGDCLFIPYHWFHQVNSEANENGQNLAVNVWFRHVHNLRPKNCNISVSEATLDKYEFSDDERGQKGGDGEEEGEGGGEGGEEGQSMVDHFEAYLFKTKRKVANFKTFMTLLQRDPVMNRDRVKLNGIPEQFQTYAREIFDRFDHSKNGVLSKTDFDAVRESDDEHLNGLEDFLTKQTARIEDFYEDIVEDSFQGQQGKENESAEPTEESTERKDEL